MDINYSEIISQVVKKNNINALKIQQFDSGEVNKVFNINDSYVVKIEGDPKYAKGVLLGQPEKVEALIKKGAKVPRILDYGEIDGKNYLLMEKVEGQHLISNWLQLSARQKENYIEQIAEQLKIFHSVKSDKYFGSCENFKDAIITETDFSSVNKTTLALEYVNSVELLENFYQKNIERLNEKNTAVQTHNDLHFENIFCKDDKITGIIDFDYAYFAAKDFELRKLIDFSYDPADYLSGDLELQYKGVQLFAEIKMLKKYYPELFAQKDLLDRLRLYLIGELLWTISGVQAGRWSENALIKTQKKIVDWYQNDWLERLLT